MFIDLLLSNFEIFILLSILFIVVAFILLFLLQLQNFRSNKNSIIEYAENINNTSKEIKEYLIVIGNLLEHQKKEILTSSVTSVKGDDLTNEPVLNVTQALQGKAAGVQIISSDAPGLAGPYAYSFIVSFLFLVFKSTL